MSRCQTCGALSSARPGVHDPRLHPEPGSQFHAEPDQPIIVRRSAGDIVDRLIVRVATLEAFVGITPTVDADDVFGEPVYRRELGHAYPWRYGYSGPSPVATSDERGRWVADPQVAYILSVLADTESLSAARARIAALEAVVEAARAHREEPESREGTRELDEALARISGIA